MNKSVLLLLAVSMTLCQCKKKKAVDNPTPSTELPSTGDNAKDMDIYLSGLKPIPQPMVQNQVIGQPINESTSDGALLCTTTKYALGKDFNEGFLLDPTSDVIYPGAILDGNSVADGGFKLISLPRTGGTISADLPNIAKASKIVDEVIKSKIDDAKLDILNQKLEGSSGAQINFDLQDIYSAKQLDVSLGLTVGIEGKAKISAGFDFSKTEKISRVLVRLQQIYYTVSFDPKGRPSDYFQPSVTPLMVSRTLDGIPTSPVYVANVKYGRLAYYSFESNERQDSLRLKVSAAFKAMGKVDVEIDAAVKKISKNSKTNITGTIIGGSGADAIKAINSFPDFLKYVTQGGEFSKESPGKPVAYTLRRLSDNGVFNVVKTSEYTVRSCKEVFYTGGVALSKVYGRNGNTELYGKIKVQIGYDGESALTSPSNDLIFNRTSGTYLPVTQGKDTENNENTTGPEIKVLNEKYDKAFLLFTADLYDYDSDKPYDTDENFDKKTTYKVYLRDLDPTKTNEVVMSEVGYTTESYTEPYEYNYANHCTHYNLAGKCTNTVEDYRTEYRTAYSATNALIDLKFTINTK